MKKLISIIILTLTLIQSINVYCLAKCEEPSVTAKGFNFQRSILNEKGIFEKEIKDKIVKVIAIDEIIKFVTNLEERTLKNAYKQLVSSWNAKLNEKTIDIIAASIKDIFSGKYGAKNAESLKKGLEYLKGISMNVELSDEEKIEAVKEGRIRSEIGMITSKGTGIAGGAAAAFVTSGIVASAAGTVGTAAGATLGAMAEVSATLAAANLNAVASGISTIAATANSIELANIAGYFATAATNILGQTAGTATAIAVTTASVVAPVFIVGATLGAGYISYKLLSEAVKVVYNEYFSKKPYDKAFDESRKNFNLLKNIEKAVCEHEWIGNNVLTVATSKTQNCDKTFANFEKLKGINSSKNTQEINNNFAALECKLLGRPNDEDCKKEALKSINCHWKNIYDTSKCLLNPYYKKNEVEDLAQNSVNKKADKEEL